MKILPLHSKCALLALCLLLLSAGNVHAAEISAGIPATAIGVGDSFIVPITLNTMGENINALEGDVWYPRQLLTLREIRDGNSILNLWVERPADINGVIHFSGITPGGFAGASGEILSLVFEARSSGSAVVSF